MPDDHVHTNCGCVVSICGSVRCKTCKHISQGSTFTSNVTKKSYEVVSSGTSMSCVDDNVVYLITCRKCGIQYVGETSQKLRNRLNNHRSSLKKLPNLYLYHHFSSDGHSEDDISIMPIEKITQDDDRASITSVRLQREDYWCRELCTYYPYGLNDNVRGIGNVSKKPGLVVNELFNRRDRRFRKRNGHRHRKRLDVNDITSRLENCLHEYKSCFFVFRIRTLVLSLPVKWMSLVWSIFECWRQKHELPDRVGILLKDLIAFRKRGTHISDINDGKEPRRASGYMNILYHNKGIDMVNLPRILNSKYVRDAVPNFLQSITPPTVSFRYTKTIAGKIFNQKKVVKGLDVNVGSNNVSCECVTSKYCYDPVGHVVTGDLTVIKDTKLRALIEKGPSYREQNYVDWRVTEKLCREAVSKYKRKWSRKENVVLSVLNEWECKVNECVKKRIASLRNKHINRRKGHILKKKRHLRSLEELHSKYVLVPADKAAQNVIVVCKKYYLEVVMREIETTATYEKVMDDATNIINQHCKYFSRKHINVPSQHKCLPEFYWLPKLHKQPYGTRFIAASHKCTTKPLSRLLTSSFKLITKHYKQYCNGMLCRTGVNCFWIIDNSQQVLSTLNKINYFSTAKCFDSYDFSTLYTSIPHAELKNALKSLIQEAYRIRDSQYIIADTNGTAYWSDIPSRTSIKHNISEDMLITFVEYLIDNIYVSIGNKVYRQCIGIPMGTDCAPLLANLFLFHYEYEYMRNLIKTNLTCAKKFSNTMRYIDDLLTLNNALFHSAIKHIYPDELTLKKTSESPVTLSYLDIQITIVNGKYSTAVYDKRDSFSFKIVNFPYLCSNIPSRPAYGVYISQLVRIARICSDYYSFASRHYKLTERLINQGFRYMDLCRAFRKFAKRHTQVLDKYSTNIRKHVENGICLPASDAYLSRHVTHR